MAVTSTMIPLGTQAPHFKLLDVCSNKILALTELAGNHGTVVMFICNHCPYVQHILPTLVSIAHQYQAKGINFIAINANDADAYPDDSPEKMRTEAIKHHFSFPYLFDATQQVARDYQAACTPDFFVFDKALKCVYRGRFDQSTPGNHLPVTGKELMGALESLLSGTPIDNNQLASMGCSIKWKKAADPF